MKLYLLPAVRSCKWKITFSFFRRWDYASLIKNKFKTFHYYAFGFFLASASSLALGRRLSVVVAWASSLFANWSMKTMNRSRGRHARVHGGGDQRSSTRRRLRAEESEFFLHFTGGFYADLQDYCIILEISLFIAALHSFVYLFYAVNFDYNCLHQQQRSSCWHRLGFHIFDERSSVKAKKYS